MKVNRSLYYLAVTIYPWLRNISNNGPMLVRILEPYTPMIDAKVGKLKPLYIGVISVPQMEPQKPI